MRYSKPVIERWIADVVNRTTHKANGVAAQIEQESNLLDIVRNDTDGKERLFAALFTGNINHLRTAEFRPNWTSWIEGHAPYHLLATSDVVLIDLAPADLSEFEELYRCTPTQLARLIESYPNSVRINLRSDDPSVYAAPEVADAVGEILALSEQFPDVFYRLEPIRRAGFNLIAPNAQEKSQRASLLTSKYGEFLCQIDKSTQFRGEFVKDLSRTTRWPGLPQVRGRIEYYLLARSIWGDDQSTDVRDDRLDEWLDADEPLVFDAEAPVSTAGLLRRLTTAHHLFTAPLTGALGGNYSMLPGEFDMAVSARVGIDAVTTFNVGLSSWLFALQAGVANLDDSDRGKTYEFWDKPTDEQWARFLPRVERNRHILQESFGDLEQRLEDAAERFSKGKSRILSPSASAADLEEVVSRLLNTWDWRHIVGTGALAVSSAFGQVHPYFAVLTLDRMWRLAKCSDHFSRLADRIGDLPLKLTRAKLDQKAILGLGEKLDLPAASS